MMLSAAQAPAAPLFDPTMMILLVLGAAMLFFMWRGNKQRAKMQQELATKMVPGAMVMTQAGIYGELVEVDEANSVATIETTPGVRIRVHRATLATVVEPTAAVPDDASSLVGETDAAAPATGTRPEGAAAGDPYQDGAVDGDDLPRRDGDEPRA